MSRLIDKSNNIKISFSQWFKLRRDMAGLTQAAISKELGVTPTTISNWEKGTSVPSLNPNQTNKLCLILKVSLSELATGFNGEAVIKI